MRYEIQLFLPLRRQTRVNRKLLSVACKLKMDADGSYCAAETERKKESRGKAPPILQRNVPK